MSESSLGEVVDRLDPELKKKILQLEGMLPKQTDSSMECDASLRSQFRNFGTLHCSEIQMHYPCFGAGSRDIKLAVKLEDDVAAGSFSGRTIGRKKEVSRLKLFDFEVYFLRWRKDRAEVIQNGVQLGTIEDIGLWRMMLSGTDGFACSVEYPFWEWRQAKCRYDCTSVSFPTSWPECGEWEKSQVQAICELTEQHRNLVVSSILWNKIRGGLSYGDD